MQGDEPCPQPALDDSSDCVLLWNGDAFQGLECTPGESDTSALLKRLAQAEDDDQIASILADIRGPFAFIFYKNGSLWFGRDVLGRHSLVVSQSEAGQSLTLCSLATSGESVEVPAVGFFQISLGQRPFKAVLRRFQDAQLELIEKLPFEVNASSQVLQSKVAHPSLSGELADFSWRERAIAQDWPEEKVFATFLQNEGQFLAQSLVEKLQKAVKVRLETRPVGSRVAVLFSGGLDSAVLAALADRVLAEDEPLDLINVAFAENAPDRLTARKAKEELSSINPKRRFRLVECDVNVEELARMRRERISAILAPSDSVLDDSIGCAVWFAARKKGCVDGQPHLSAARVLLLGMGADEQLAGYSRHRATFDKAGLLGLTEELRLELARIGERNLGRDDRVASDHGVAARYPFLDEDVVAFLSSLKTTEKADLRLPRGCGEKLLLRAAAWGVLGLKATAREAKRAIQFGSRIAKAEYKKEKGHQK